jgi:hypothetical protein
MPPLHLLASTLIALALAGCGDGGAGIASNTGGATGHGTGGSGGKPAKDPSPTPDPSPGPDPVPNPEPTPEPTPYAGPASNEVWSMAGVFVYDPKTFSADTYGPVLKQNHVGWVALQIVDGSSEKWPCEAEPCAAETAEGFLRSWRPWVKWVGAWGVNRANSSEDAVRAEAKLAVSLIDEYEASESHVDFFIADAEAEYEYSKCGACVSASAWWASEFRAAKPAGSFEAAVSSYGRTDLADVYWMSWRDSGFQFLPQAYWNDPNMAGTFKPSVCLELSRICPGSPEAASHGLNCTGSPTDCPCWPVSSTHPTIGYGWGQSTPSIDEYIDDLASAHDSLGSTGFSIFEGQYIPASSDAWTKLGDAIATRGIATAP